MISLQEGKGPGRKKPVPRVLCLRMVVTGTQPRVWRRLLVRETMWLSRLHDSIQIAFDWFDYQTHAFALDDLRFGNPVKRDDLNVEDDRDVTLADLNLVHRDRMTYEYQIGEGWRVDVRVEKAVPPGKGMLYPLCVAGERAGPPEDCGGLEAFHDMLACLKEPSSELGREWLGWLGPDYDPGACDLDKVNRALRKLGK
jgi:Plasmid pRiA4b ORF-3-like protein